MATKRSKQTTCQIFVESDINGSILEKTEAKEVVLL